MFTSESGEIVSPGFHSGNYRPDMICEWEIRLPENSRIRLTWLQFDVESSRTCTMDNVQVRSRSKLFFLQTIAKFVVGVPRARHKLTVG